MRKEIEMQELVKQIWLKGSKTHKEEDSREFSIAFQAIKRLFDPLHSTAGYSIGVYTRKPKLYILFLKSWPQEEEVKKLRVGESTEEMYWPTGEWDTIETGSFAGQRAQVYKPRNLSTLWSRIQGFLELGCAQYDVVTSDNEPVRISNNNLWIYEKSSRLHVLSLKDNSKLIEEGERYTEDSRTNPLYKCFLGSLIVKAAYSLYPGKGFNPKGTVEEASEALSVILSQSLPTTHVLTTASKTYPISDYVKLEREERFGVARWAVEKFVTPTVYGDNPVYDGRGSYAGSSVRV